MVTDRKERVLRVNQLRVRVLEGPACHLRIETLELVDGGEGGPGELKGSRGVGPHLCSARLDQRADGVYIAAFIGAACSIEAIHPHAPTHGRLQHQLFITA